MTVAIVGAALLALGRAEVTKLAFGSCSKPSLPQPLWGAIREYGPHVWVWGGDNVYADERPTRAQKAAGETVWRWVGPRAPHVNVSHQVLVDCTKVTNADRKARLRDLTVHPDEVMAPRRVHERVLVGKTRPATLARVC